MVVVKRTFENNRRLHNRPGAFSFWNAEIFLEIHVPVMLSNIFMFFWCRSGNVLFFVLSNSHGELLKEIISQFFISLVDIPWKTWKFDSFLTFVMIYNIHPNCIKVISSKYLLEINIFNKNCKNTDLVKNLSSLHNFLADISFIDIGMNDCRAIIKVPYNVP